MDLTLKPETHLTKQPPPPLHHSFFHLRPPHPGGSFPVIAVAVIGILATAFLLVSYYIFVIKCCLNWHRIDLLRRLSSPRHRPSSASCATEPRGLDDSLIRAIPIIKFHKDSNEKGSVFECAVCLSEFEEEEKLRVIPNCCHAFHIDCIDVWLQTNANCPLCRSIISPNSLISIDQKINISSGSQNLDLGNENFTGNDEDYVVIEIQDNNLDQPRLVSAQERSNSDELSAFSISPSPKKGTKLHKKLLKQGKVASFGDECIELRNKDEEFQIIQPIRRSISMDSSKDRQFYLQIQEEIQQRNGQVNEVSFNSEGCSSRSVKRSIFSLNNDSEKGSRRDV